MSRLEGLDIVCVALPAWEGEYAKSTVELCRRLSTRNRVLYVNYPLTWMSIARGVLRNGKASVRGTPRFRSTLTEVDAGGGHVHVLTPPPAIPSNGLPAGPLQRAVMWCNARRVERSIKRAMDRIGMSEPIVINAFNPFYGCHLAGRLGERLLAYYCYDEIGAAPWTARHGPAAERRFLDKVDVVVTTSSELQRTRSQRHPRTFLVRNGVSFEHFNRARRLAQELAPRPRRCVGYLGSLDERVDYALLAAVMDSCTEWDFLFVGRAISPGAALLESRPNARLVGARPPDELPAFLAEMDVCVIPFVCDDFTRAIYPLKINEYLAAAKPVVMTPFAPLHEFDGLVEVAGPAREFAQAVRRAWSSDNEELRARRVAAARSNSWNRRALELENVLARCLGGEAA